ncbi:hypothetical protein HY485_04900 [Candidatus Woesearchaeota archaeon]|nr:hypothetical protein [Candidatus Woesearchaeota archaeon]
MVERVPVSDKELEDIIGRNLSEYDSIPFEDIRDNVREALRLITTHGLPKGLKERFTPVREGSYKSGEVWIGAYDIVYLYLGQFKNKPEDGASDASPCDVVITVGGDTPYIFETNYVNDNQKQDYFWRRVFPAFWKKREEQK